MVKPFLEQSKKKTNLNLLTTFSAFKPHGNQDYESFVPLLIQNINETIPKIANIAEFDDRAEIINFFNIYNKNKNTNSDQIQEKIGLEILTYVVQIKLPTIIT